MRLYAEALPAALTTRIQRYLALIIYGSTNSLHMVVSLNSNDKIRPLQL